VAAVVAVHTQEPVRQHAPVEMGADLALDEPCHRRSRLACASQKRLELSADDVVEERLFGLMAFAVRRSRTATPDQVRGLMPYRPREDCVHENGAGIPGDHPGSNGITRDQGGSILLASGAPETGHIILISLAKRASPRNEFQDRCLRPLGHLSAFGSREISASYEP
jgi:hypothetical protein